MRKTVEGFGLNQQLTHLKFHFPLNCIGEGTTNDGISVQKFFYHPALSVKRTGIDEALIQRFAVITTVLNSG